MPKCIICKSKHKVLDFGKTCSYPCLQVHLANIRHKQLKAKLNDSLPKLKEKAKKVFQAWIRNRDKNLPCISCGKTNCDFHAGHYFSAGQFSGLVFDERNVHKQCVQCNTHLHGNTIGYRQGLINRYGEDYVIRLESEANSKRFYKFNRFELKEIIKKYK